MQSAEINRRFLSYFESRGHTIVPSSSLISDDPTLLLVPAGMVPLKGPRILGWRDVLRRHRLVVGPQGDREAVTHVDARLHPRFRLFHRAARLSESPTNLDFELSACLVR